MHHLLMRVLFLGALFGAFGCGGARQIQTSPPQPAQLPGRPPDADGQTALLSVDIRVGESALPQEVRALRFRVEEVRLKGREGGWVAYPADVNSFEITAMRRPVVKTIFSTRIPPQAYDSLALVLSDVFVLYDENAGGPLTAPRDTPLRLGLAVAPAVAAPARVELTLEPGASLTHDASCRWFFLPFWRVATDG